MKFITLVEFLESKGYIIRQENDKWIFEIDQDEIGEETRTFDTLTQACEFALTEIPIENLL